MHELSLGTWFIHIATLFEWSIAIIIIDYISSISKNKALGYFALAMLPNLEVPWPQSLGIYLTTVLN